MSFNISPSPKKQSQLEVDFILVNLKLTSLFFLPLISSRLTISQTISFEITNDLFSISHLIISPGLYVL